MAIFKSTKVEMLRPCDYVSHTCGGELILDSDKEQDLAFINEQAEKLELPADTSIVIKMMKVGMSATQAMLEKEYAYYESLPLKRFAPKIK
jgi:hypothetical protein